MTAAWRVWICPRRGSFASIPPMIRFGLPQKELPMSIVDDFVENLVERNAVRVSGALAVQLVDGGVRITGAFRSTLRDQRNGKDVLHTNIPVIAHVKIGEVVLRLSEVTGRV